MSQTRFSRRMYEHYPYGAEYGCAIHRFERKAASIAVYIACAIGFFAAMAACFFS